MIYAIPSRNSGWNGVEDERPYLIAGKRYPVLKDDGILFETKPDHGNPTISCLWTGCAHIDGGDWTRVDD